MNKDETEKEINRHLASLNSPEDTENIAIPLFPRVHEALWRQIANGKLKTTSNSRPGFRR